jgi:hypothetical protein
MCCHPTTLCGIWDSGLLDMTRGCSAGSPKGLPEQVKYTALDARLGFETARKFF